MIVDNNTSERFDVKVFISYSTADKSFALKLARWLKRKHIFAYLDAAPEETSGSGLPRFDRPELAECRVLCICLSNAYVLSRWIPRTVHSFGYSTGDRAAWSAAVAYSGMSESSMHRHPFDDSKLGCTIVRCMREVVEIPPSLVHSTCANFLSSFRTGFNEIWRAVELEHKKGLRQSEIRQERWFESLLTPPDTKLFLEHFRENGSFYPDEWEPNSYRKLVSSQVLNIFRDDDIPHYVLTDLGAELYAYLESRGNKL